METTTYSIFNLQKIPITSYDIGTKNPILEVFGMAKFRGTIKLCMSCGKEFKVPPTRVISAKYCSKVCADLHRNDGKMKEKAEIICRQCGTKFYEYPSHKDQRAFCSTECRSIYQSKDKISLSCQQCGKAFIVKPSLEGKKYCSMVCRGLAHSENFSGENCHAWRGGIVTTTQGYLTQKVPFHPFVDGRGYIKVHRLVMEVWLKGNRPDSPYLIKLGDNLYLSPDYVVHHKNGIVTDNRIENLQVMKLGEHSTHHNLNRNN